MTSIKKNIIYKALLSTSNYLLALVTFPYVTRVLGPEDFGTVNFAMNTIDYFLLLATMGIVNIGTREIAINKDNKKNLSQVYSNILGVNCICTVVTIVIYLSAVFFIARFYEIKQMLLIGLAKIVFAVFAVEWLFSGLEKFRYITIRSVIVKILYVVSVFVLIKSTADTYLYFILTISSVVVNNAINFLYSFKFVKPNLKGLLSLKYLKPNLKLGIYAILTSMYVTFNVMYLGLTTDDLQVGFYSAGVKLYFVAVTLFSSYTSVMMPRLSAILKNNDFINYNRYLSLSYNIVFIISLPIIILCVFYAPELITILSGSDYDNSILPMRIIMPALLPVWIASVIAFQVFIPNKKDNVLMNASIFGGIIALILNVLVVPKMGAVGSAITLVSCETCVMAYYVYTMSKYRTFYLPDFMLILSYVLRAIPYVIICIMCSYLLQGLVSLICGILISGTYFLVINRKILLKIIGKGDKSGFNISI